MGASSGTLAAASGGPPTLAAIRTLVVKGRHWRYANQDNLRIRRPAHRYECAQSCPGPARNRPKPASPKAEAILLFFGIVFPPSLKISSWCICPSVHRFGWRHCSEATGDMTARSITSLRKKNAKGELYTRPTNIEGKLAEIVALSHDEISARCSVADGEDPTFLPSECLVYLVRANRDSPPGVYFETLYKTLLARVLRRLPSEEITDLTEGNIRSETVGNFVELLAADRANYDEALDYFEIRFESALVSLRANVERKSYREKKRSAALEIDDKPGEIAEHVERAAGSFDPFDFEEIDHADYRLRLDKAISTLPKMQIAIVEMIQKGIPIDSKEPGTVTIARTLGKAEKTIRLQRDKAYRTLCEALKKGEKA